MFYDVRKLLAVFFGRMRKKEEERVKMGIYIIRRQ
jgi:hypothetical protein